MRKIQFRSSMKKLLLTSVDSLIIFILDSIQDIQKWFNNMKHTLAKLLEHKTYIEEQCLTIFIWEKT